MKINQTALRLSALALGFISLTSISFGQWQLAGNIVAAGNVLGSTNNADLRIITNNTDRIRVLGSNGNVGIGTATPTASLHITGTNITTSPLVAGTQIGAGMVVLTRAGDPGYPFIDFIDNPTGAIYDSRLIYNNNFAVDRLEVRGSGFSVDNTVLIGATYATAGPGLASNSLFVENQLGVGYTSNPGTYTFYVNGTAWASGGYFGSDSRWKENVTTLDRALEKVMRLRGVTYDFRSKEYPDLRFPEGKQIGFIAQEVERVVPEVVVTNNDGYKGVAYQDLVALLTQGMQEQQALIERLNARVANLEARLEGKSDLGQIPSEMEGATAVR